MKVRSTAMTKLGLLAPSSVAALPIGKGAVAVITVRADG